VRLSGKADAFNTVDNLKNLLGGSQHFAKVTITDAKARPTAKGAVQHGAPAKGGA